MKNKKASKILSMYWFVILFIVAGAVVYMAFLFYGAPYDVRGIESNALTMQIANCLARGGYLKPGILGEDFANNFLDFCNLNLDVEDVYGWGEQGQYYFEVGIHEFDENSLSGFGTSISEIVEGNPNLKTALLLETKKKANDKLDRIVIHYTESPTLQSAVNEFENRNDKSIHYIIDRDGYIMRGEVGEDEVAFHAGCWKRPDCSESPNDCCIDGMNERSIGIELVNLGNKCGDEDNKRLCNFGGGETCKEFCQDQGEGSEIGGVVWEDFSEEQMDALANLVADISFRQEIPIDREHVIGHNEVDIGRKSDPGDAFDWDKFMQDANSIESFSPSIEKGFYVLDGAGNSYMIKILTIVGKEEKNVA